MYKLHSDCPLLHGFLELVRKLPLLFNSQQICGIEEKLIEYTYLQPHQLTIAECPLTSGALISHDGKLQVVVDSHSTRFETKECNLEKQFHVRRYSEFLGCFSCIPYMQDEFCNSQLQRRVEALSVVEILLLKYC